MDHRGIVNIRPELTLLDEKITDIIKVLTEAYNSLRDRKLKTATNANLDYAKKIIETLRSLHCAVLHNENVANQMQSTRAYWLESHHDVVITIRDNIHNLQNEQREFDFTNVHNHVLRVFEACQAFLQTLIEATLKQNYFARIALYRYHLKALTVFCTLYDHRLPFANHLRSQETEMMRISIMQRAIDLQKSFQNGPHPLHTLHERPEHDDFTKFM